VAVIAPVAPDEARFITGPVLEQYNEKEVS